MPSATHPSVSVLASGILVSQVVEDEDDDPDLATQCVWFKIAEPPQSPPVAPPPGFYYSGPPVTPFAPCQCVDVLELKRCVCLPEGSEGIDAYTIGRLERHYGAAAAAEASASA